LLNYVDAKLAEATHGGRKLTFEQTQDIIYAAKRKLRAELGLTGNLKDLNGQYHDFQEVRRPFVAPNNESHTH
jgi:hypothetical protein